MTRKCEIGKWPPNGKLVTSRCLNLRFPHQRPITADSAALARADWLESSASRDGIKTRRTRSRGRAHHSATSRRARTRATAATPARYPRAPRTRARANAAPTSARRARHRESLVSRRKFPRAALSRKWRRPRRERRRRRRPRPDLGRRPPRDAWPHDPGQRPRRRSRGASASGPARPDGPPMGRLGGPPSRLAVGTRRRGGASRAAPRAR